MQVSAKISQVKDVNTENGMAEEQLSLTNVYSRQESRDPVYGARFNRLINMTKDMFPKCDNKTSNLQFWDAQKKPTTLFGKSRKRNHQTTTLIQTRVYVLFSSSRGQYILQFTQSPLHQNII